MSLWSFVASVFHCRSASRLLLHAVAAWDFEGGWWAGGRGEEGPACPCTMARNIAVRSVRAGPLARGCAGGAVAVSEDAMSVSVGWERCSLPDGVEDIEMVNARRWVMLGVGWWSSMQLISGGGHACWAVHAARTHARGAKEHEEAARLSPPMFSLNLTDSSRRFLYSMPRDAEEEMGVVKKGDGNQGAKANFRRGDWSQDRPSRRRCISEPNAMVSDLPLQRATIDLRQASAFWHALPCRGIVAPSSFCHLDCSRGQSTLRCGQIRRAQGPSGARGSLEAPSQQRRCSHGIVPSQSPLA